MSTRDRNGMDLQRRDFLKILGGATVATVMPGCTPKKPASLIPYVIPHEEIIPGQSVWYATTCRECPAGCGLHVRVREGRAVKVEGNPVHPINRGALCSRGHASLQGLYNPDRIQTPLLRRPDGSYAEVPWSEAETIISGKIDELVSSGRGSRIAWLTSHLTGSLDEAVSDFLRAVGSRRRLRYEPIAYEGISKANELMYGTPAIPQYRFDRAQFVLSFGADYLETWLSPVQFTRNYTSARSFNGAPIPRSVYVGPRLSLTAANADEWIQVASGEESLLALGLLHSLVANGDVRVNAGIRGLIQSYSPAFVSERTGISEDRIRTLAGELASARPSIVVAGGTVGGDASGIGTCLAVNLLNESLGNVGRTIEFGVGQSLSNVNTYADFVRFTRSMEQDEISLLFFMDANPVFSSPASGNAAHAFAKVPFTVALSSSMDESTATASLILPSLTPLESWGDYEPEPGVSGLMQPVMQPVFPQARMAGDILLWMTEHVTGRMTFTGTAQPFLAYIRNRWQRTYRTAKTSGSFDQWWTEALANGGVFSPQPGRSRRPSMRSSASQLRPHLPTTSPSPAGSGLALVVYPSIHHYDGRGANRPWLQEVPDPMTQLTWENWVEIHPSDAERLGIAKGNLVEVRSPHGSVELRAYPYAGVMPGTAAIPIGQGHAAFGRFAEKNGANVFALISPVPSASSGGIRWDGVRVELVNKGDRKQLADVAGSDYLHGRNLVQVVTAEELMRQTRELADKRPDETADGLGREGGPSLYPEHEHPDHRWGMTVDLDKCTGCSACVTACYAENNIPVVGKHQVEIGRELSWLRVERYFDDGPVDETSPAVIQAEFLPMMCQQCDNAPCEPVCPVYAAYHTPEGLNAQVYNRCVGTRYCANNCPYKVRRFNWFDYEFPEPLNWQLNPDVTVRTKGVMEKCTFCVQRIVEGRTKAKQEGRDLADGEIKTACQQTCPAQAIVFGDLKDPNSEVSTLRGKHRVRGYRALEELNTQPAVTYLKEIR